MRPSPRTIQKGGMGGMLEMQTLLHDLHDLEGELRDSQDPEFQEFLAGAFTAPPGEVAMAATHLTNAAAGPSEQARARQGSICMLQHDNTMCHR